MKSPEEVVTDILDIANRIALEKGSYFGPSGFEWFLADGLHDLGLCVKPVEQEHWDFRGVKFTEPTRFLLVENCVLVEVRDYLPGSSPFALTGVLRQIRLWNIPLGLEINLGAENFAEAVTLFHRDE